MLYILLGAVVLFFLAFVLLRLGHIGQRAIGLPQGKIVYSDTSQWLPVERPLLSRRYGIVGKPDYVIANQESRKGMMIPVEVKSGKKRRSLPVGHLLQLGAYCLLVEEQYGVAPEFGLLRYANATVQVPFTPELRMEVLAVAEEIRATANAKNVERDHESVARCRACGYRHACGSEVL